MKLLILSLVFGLACASGDVWEIQELLNALTSPITDRSIAGAMGMVVAQVVLRGIFGGLGPMGRPQNYADYEDYEYDEDYEYEEDYGSDQVPRLKSGDFVIFTPPGSIGSYQKEQLEEALRNSTTSPVFLPYFQLALDQLNKDDRPNSEIDVALPTLQISNLNLQELDALISNTSDELLKTYYETARSQLQQALDEGLTLKTMQKEKVDRIVVATPVTSIEAVMAAFTDGKIVAMEPPKPVDYSDEDYEDY